MPNLDRTGRRGQGYRDRVPRRAGVRTPPQRRQAQEPGGSARAAKLAESLGAEPEFTDRIKERGAERTIREYLENVDETGVMAKMFRLLQQFAVWLERRVSEGRPPKKNELNRVVARLAEKYDVKPAMAQRFVRETLERYRDASATLSGRKMQQPPPQPIAPPEEGQEGQQQAPRRTQ